MESKIVRKNLDSLRELVKDLMVDEPLLDDDIYLLQWLRVKKNNVSQAESAIRASFAWRKETNVEELANEEFPAEMRNRFPLRFDFDSRNGLPVCFGREDDMGLVGLLKLYGRTVVTRYFIYQAIQMEKILTDFNRKKNENVDRLTLDDVLKYVAIFDGECYSLKHVSSVKVLQLYCDLASIYVKSFPHLVSVLYHINTNKFNRIGLTMVKPLLTGYLDDFRLYGAEDTWSQEIFSMIEPHVLRRLQSSPEK